MFGLVLMLNYVWDDLPSKVRTVLYWAINIYVGFLIFNFIVIGVEGIRLFFTSPHLAIFDFWTSIHLAIVDQINLMFGAVRWILYTAFGIINP
jgi:hypothetical protein